MKFLSTLLGRFKDLLIKLVSVKGVVAIGTGVVFVLTGSDAAAWVFAAALGLLIGGRAFEKYVRVLEKLRGISNGKET